MLAAKVLRLQIWLSLTPRELLISYCSYDYLDINLAYAISVPDTSSTWWILVQS
jgi:hypothetical protein